MLSHCVKNVCFVNEPNKFLLNRWQMKCNNTSKDALLDFIRSRTNVRKTNNWNNHITTKGVFNNLPNIYDKLFRKDC